jgi:hypothetical protein
MQKSTMDYPSHRSTENRGKQSASHLKKLIVSHNYWSPSIKAANWTEQRLCVKTAIPKVANTFASCDGKKLHHLVHNSPPRAPVAAPSSALASSPSAPPQPLKHRGFKYQVKHET